MCMCYVLCMLVYVHYFIRENFRPLDTMSEAAILHLAQQQIQQLLDLVGLTLSRQTQWSYPLTSKNSAAGVSPLSVFFSPL